MLILFQLANFYNPSGKRGKGTEKVEKKNTIYAAVSVTYATIRFGAAVAGRLWRMILDEADDISWAETIAIRWPGKGQQAWPSGSRDVAKL